MKSKIHMLHTVFYLMLFLLLAPHKVVASNNFVAARAEENGSCCAECNPRTAKISRWQKEDGSLEKRIKKLEGRYWNLMDANKLTEGSVARRKADNLLKTIRDLQEKERNIPGEIYRATVDLKGVLDDA